MFAAGSTSAAAGWHATCRSRECGCLHHRDARRSISEILQSQVRQRLIAQGIDLEAANGPRLECLRGHDLTVDDALNSHGECRECRRNSTRQYKQRVRERLEAERAAAEARRRAGLPPSRGIVVPALPRLWIVQSTVVGQVVTALPPVQRGRRLAG
jgi:hypothetical protein